MSLNKLTILITALLLASTGSAATFTVNTTADPQVVNAGNCTHALQACSLREALAAADQSALHDTIEFEIDGTIHLTRPLSAAQPVTIDGGEDKTVIRVHQGYNIVTLTDVFFPYEQVPVLQPTYYSVRSWARPMLALSGDGSVVTNLELDGSITPDPSDLGVARIDYDSNDETGFLLFTMDKNGDGVGDRWPIGGGILVNFEPASPGTIEISDNEMNYMNDTAITVVFTSDAHISDNEIKVAYIGDHTVRQYFHADGIYAYESQGIVVADNEISGLRNGVAITAGSGATLSGNEVTDNWRSGLWIESMAFGSITENQVRDNGEFGILVAGAFNAVSDNEVKGNGSNPDTNGGILLYLGFGNTVGFNESMDNSGFGIAIDQSTDNTITNNSLKGNGGSGITLISTDPDGPLAARNLVEDNTISGSATGIMAGFVAPFPLNNAFLDNLLWENGYDVVDFDPQCNDSWANNGFTTAYAASGDCIH
jgi:CSLREA domain-containing protein